MQFSLRWRLLALAGLIVYVLSIIALLYVILFNPIFIIVTVSTVTILVYAGWLIFTGQGRRHQHGLWLGGLAMIALIAELIAFAREPGNTRTLAFAVIFGLAYIGVFSVLRQQYWLQKRRAAQQTAHFKHPVLIINPKAGNGRALKARLADEAQRQGIRVITSQPRVEIEALARQAVAKGADVLGVSGGDGSIGAVAKVALEHDLPLVVLPGGTRCHFARDIGLDPNHLVGALAGFKGVERRVDVGSINGRIFLNNVSFGTYADMVNRPDYRNNKLAVTRKVLQELVTQNRLYDLRFNINGKDFSKAAMILIGVNRYDTIHLLELGHRDKLNEGVLQINVVAEVNDASVRRLLKGLAIKRLTSGNLASDIQQSTTQSFTVSSPHSSLVVGVDGEKETYTTPVEIKCLPSTLRLYVPAEGDRPRQKSAFNFAGPKEMWHAVIGRFN